MSRLTVCISGHGYGHAAQLAVVVNQLRYDLPNLELLIRSPLPNTLLGTLFIGEFEHTQTQTDFGMSMHSAVDVDANASQQAYSNFHQDWSNKVDSMANALSAGRPDLVLSNIPYLEIEGASRAGIPSAGLCSLNWADIYSAYCGELPDAEQNLAIMRKAYQQADLLIQVTPGIPMSDYSAAKTVGPVARIGQHRNTELKRLISASSTQRVVLVNLGGISMRLPVEQWPEREDIIWIIPSAWEVARDDCIAVESLPMSFLDVMCSADAFITKVGYGALVEAACNDVPTLFLPRGDWPEEPWLVPWFIRHARSQSITLDQLNSGDLSASIDRVCGLSAPEHKATPTGIEKAALQLRKLIDVE